MSPSLGKVSPELFERAIAPFLGAARTEVLVGPGTGSDCAIVRIGAGRVLAITTDPLSLVPAIGLEASARLSCHLLASDLWTSGIPPAYVSVSFQLPPTFEDEVFERYWRAMSEAWSALGVAVVAGHTGRYPGCDLSIVGAATLVGIGDEGRFLTPAAAMVGDRVIVTKGCAVETAAIAGHLLPERMTAIAGDEGVAAARAMLAEVSVVADCRAVLRVGVRSQGVTALHDATEGGVLGGLLELAKACGHDLRVERARIPLAPAARAACEAFGGIDPWWALSEGTLIATVRPERRDAALAALADDGIVAADVGEVMRGHGVLWLTDGDGTVRTIERPEPDPYWPAYARAVDEGWR